MFFVLDLDDSDPNRPKKGAPARKPVDLDAAPEETAKAAKGDGKLEIVRDPDSTYRRRAARVDPIKARRQRTVITSVLVVLTVAALGFIALQMLNKKPTFEEARDAPLPVTSTPAPAANPGRASGPAPVLANPRSNPVETMPGLNPSREGSEDDRPTSGIH